MPYPTKLKGGWQRPCQVVVNKSTVQIRESKATRKFVNRYQEILQNNMAEGPKDPQGPFLYQEGGNDVCLPSCGDAPEYTEESTFRQNAKRLQGGRHRNSQDYNGKGPCDSYVNPTGVFTKCRSRDNASDEQSSNDEGNGRKCDREQPDQVFNDGVSGYRTSDPIHSATTTKMQVTHVALQTDLCDTLYITKNALTAYTIAIVQNAQALQYDQMHVVL